MVRLPRRTTNLLIARIDSVFQEYIRISQGINEKISTGKIRRVLKAKLASISQPETVLSQKNFNLLVYQTTGTLLQQHGFPVDRDRLKQLVRNNANQTLPQDQTQALQGRWIDILSLIAGFLGLLAPAAGGLFAVAVSIQIVQPTFIQAPFTNIQVASPTVVIGSASTPVIPNQEFFFLAVMFGFLLLVAILARYLLWQFGCLTRILFAAIILGLFAVLFVAPELIVSIFPDFNPQDAEQIGFVFVMLVVGILVTLSFQWAIRSAFGRMRANMFRFTLFFLTAFVFGVLFWLLLLHYVDTSFVRYVFPWYLPRNILHLNVLVGLVILVTGAIQLLISQLRGRIDFSFLNLRTLYFRLSIVSLVALVGATIISAVLALF